MKKVLIFASLLSMLGIVSGCSVRLIEEISKFVGKD